MAKGNRGGKRVGGGWKSQLKQMAKDGKMPISLTGSEEQRSKVFIEINKLYAIPQTKYKSIIDQGDGIYINFGNSVKRASYPSGKNATQEEKDGVKKWLLYNK